MGVAITPPRGKDIRARILSEARRARGARAPQRWVGLDLGSRSLKLVELESTPAGVRLLKSLIQELPVPAEGQAVDRAGWLQSALKEFAASDVHVSAGGPEVAMRRVAVPLMSRQELPEAVKWQVKEQLPFPVQDALLDCRVTGEVWEKDIKKQDVLVAAAGRAFIQSLLETVERAGVRVASVSPTHAALWACASALVPDIGRGSAALVEIGAGQTEVTIAKDGQIRLVRDLAVGSDSLTGSLVGVVVSEHGQTAIDRSRAEALKRRYGVLADAAEGTTEDGVPLFHLSSLMRPVLEHLLTELSRVFSFYRVQMDDAGVSRLLLCGGGATLKQLQSYLADGLGMTVEVFNPLLRLSERSQPLEPEQVAEGGPRLGTAIGLALEHGQGLNLVPVEVQRSRETAVTRIVWARAAAWAGAAAAVVYLGLQLFSAALGGRIAHQREAWGRLAPSYEQGLRTAASAQNLDVTVDQVGRLLERQPVWDGLLKELGTLVPATIELSELTVSAEGPPGRESLSFRMKGTGAAAAVAGEGSIAQFLDAMERSVFFADVQLVRSEMDTADSSRVSVEIQGKLE
jgi:type IV pilus assembly protein PilM